MTRTLPERARSLQAQARVSHTPCGEASLVWHIWGEGPPVVLFHGGSGSWTHWLHNIPALVRAGHSVLVPDLPGFGDSAVPPSGGDADACIEPLEAGLRMLVPGPFQLVCFSFGTLVGALLAACTPRVQQLILLGAPVIPLVHGRGVVLKDWRHLRSEEERDAVHAHNLRAIMFHSPAAVTDEAISLQALNVPRDRLRRRRLVTTSLLSETLAGLRCPTWLFYGLEDLICRNQWDDLAERVRALAAVRGMRGVPGVGHWVQYEAPELTNCYLIETLRHQVRQA